ncbi:MAG: metallophosphoesterase [Hyphomicrobiaceae bacterium]|nr:metallophosphoesterase [Hyphomicrobiaceae bacterium]
MAPLIDPRLGDIEDDGSSTKQRSLFALAGSLLAEISLPKLAAAWLILIVLPGMLLGLAPLIASAWLAMISRKIAAPLSGLWPLVLLALVLALGWIGGRPLVRAAERGFWSLNSLAVQPGYALCREGLRHLAEHWLMPRAGAEGRARLRAFTAAVAGLVLCGIALGLVALVWPASRWTGNIADIASPRQLVVPALANAVIVVSAYLGAAALVWGIADATMDQPRDLAAFDEPAPAGRIWRVAHLSDLHVVGERFGFRIESGRSGPRGNGRLTRILARLEAIHAAQPLDLILVTGDMTDAGRSAEWAELLAELAGHPELASRMLVLPGNHDVNVVDRANPARLELPTSPGRRLREMRALSVMGAVQGDRVNVIDPASGRLGDTLSGALEAQRRAIAAFADAGTLRLSAGLQRVWSDVFPMVLPPRSEDGLGVVLLNSNAQTHFSFTNALGLISVEQARRLAQVTRQFPRACWIVALHHHLVEYPKLATVFSERIGTALINGTWFVRQLSPLGDRIVAMHGHRHVDWIGECGGVRIISAPSPVMEATDEQPTCFHIHGLATGPDGRLRLLAPERIEIAGYREQVETTGE